MKLVLWFAPLMLVTIGITGVYSYNVASNEIVNKMSQEQVGSAHEAIAHLDYVAQDALDISNYFYLSPEIQALLYSDSTNGNLLSIDINSTINRMMVTRPFFQFLTIYSFLLKNIRNNLITINLSKGRILLYGALKFRIKQKVFFTETIRTISFC
jgi:two-component system sensor histidine kinase YesM